MVNLRQIQKKNNTQGGVIWVFLQDGKEKNFSDIHKESSRSGNLDKTQEVLAGH